MPQADEKLPPGTNYCLCAGCGEYFNSAFAFNKHRTGKATDRRCLDTAEMAEIGMQTNSRGYWVSEKLKTRPDYVGEQP